MELSLSSNLRDCCQVESYVSTGGAAAGGHRSLRCAGACESAVAVAHRPQAHPLRGPRRRRRRGGHGCGRRPRCQEAHPQLKVAVCAWSYCSSICFETQSSSCAVAAGADGEATDVDGAPVGEMRIHSSNSQYAHFSFVVEDLSRNQLCQMPCCRCRRRGSRCERRTPCQEAHQ